MTFLIHRNNCRELDKMRTQRDMSKWDNRMKFIVKELNEMEISYMPDRKLKVMVIKILSG